MSKRILIPIALVTGGICLLVFRWAAEDGDEAGAYSGAARVELPGRSVSVPARLQLAPFDPAPHRAAHPVRKGRPLRFAVAAPVSITPASHGRWESVEGQARWTLEIDAPGAVNLNFGFERFALPEGATLEFHSSEGDLLVRPFTAEDNESHGQLWTPVMAGETVGIELTVAEHDRAAVDLKLASINRGFRELRFAAAHQKIGSGSPAGNCHIDVVCSAVESGVGSAIDFYRDQIRSAGVYTLNGRDQCSGAAVNSAGGDRTPFFLTADHCGVRASNAPTMVVYWNFENSFCRTPGTVQAGDDGDGPVTDFNSGAIFRATDVTSDATLVELDDPIRPEHRVFLAGWSRGGPPTMTACVHHPATSEKRISIDVDPAESTADSSELVNPNATHWRVVDWDFGSTEGGSSGSPLFDQDGRIVGQLSGGFAACGNNESDWYGKFGRAWTGGGTSASRLSNWLDPEGTGALAIDGVEAAGSAIRIADGEVMEGDSGTSLLQFTVTLSEAAGEVVDLSWSTRDGAAVGGSDFTTVSDAPLSFAVGETSKVVAVEVSGDTDPEENERFEVILALVGSPAAYLADSEATGTILNDDFIPPVVVGPATVNGAVSEELMVAVTAQNSPTGFSLGGEPAGMTIDASGLIRWVPVEVGSFEVVVTASNPAGPGSGTVTFEIAANPLVEAVEAPSGLVLSTGGAVPWGASPSLDSIRLGDVASSGGITNNQVSWLQVEVEGPDYLGFWWKVSSEEGFDDLTVTLDEGRRGSISGEEPWTYKVLAIPAGSHVVRWTYAKDESLSMGADAGRVDFLQLASRSVPFLMEGPDLKVLAGETLDYQVPTFRGGAVFDSVTLPEGVALDSGGEWSGTPQLPGLAQFDLTVQQDGQSMTVPGSLRSVAPDPVGEAVNQAGLVWIVDGEDDSEWYAQSNVSRDGLAAKERNVDHDEEAEMSAYVFGPGEISFWWWVSSEEGFDGLIFEINGEFQDSLSGDEVADWEQVSFSLPYGIHKVSWFYVKDADISKGLDTGWVDQVEFSGYTDWAMTAGIGSGTNVMLDPDRDGQALLFEYATGGSATDWDPMPTPSLQGGLLEWAVAKRPGAVGVALDVEVSGSLAGWNRVERTILQDDVVLFRARDTVGGAGARFIRGTAHPAE